MITGTSWVSYQHACLNQFHQLDKRDRKSAYKQQQDEPEPVAETSKPKLTILAPLPQETKRKNTDDSNIDAFFAAKKSKKAPVADTWDDLPQENWSRVIEL